MLDESGRGETFAKLIGPISAELFFAKFWGREYLHAERKSPAYYSDFFELEDIDLLLQSEQLPAAFVNVVSNGEALPLESWSRVDKAARGEAAIAVPDRLLSLFQGGATLILNQIHRAVPRLGRVCARLSDDLGFPVRVNAYITPPGAQGFGRHADDHEILILQIGGAKKFVVYPDGDPIELDLQAGDLLYLPRGLFHEARTLCGASVHLSMGLHAYYAFDLVAQLGALAKENPDFQRPVPNSPQTRGLSEDFRSEFMSALEKLISGASPNSLLDRVGSTRRVQAIFPAGRFMDALLIHDISVNTVVIRRPGITIAIEEEGREVEVHFAGARVTIASFLKASLDQLLDGNPIKIGVIRGMLSDEAKVRFVKSLLEAGLILIVSI